eukprot:jgi/Tetstr1/460822/TSEL_005983.t1
MHALNFEDEQASEGWYRGFMKRHNLLIIGNERPHEMTRHEWLTLGNLENYFDVDAELFLKACVGEVNLDSTDSTKGMTERGVRAGPEDDGECIDTKSSSSATAVGSLNEKGAVDYVKQVMYHALGSPPPRSESPYQQGVVICDGVGTHIDFSVLEAAMDLGM